MQKLVLVLLFLICDGTFAEISQKAVKGAKRLKSVAKRGLQMFEEEETFSLKRFLSYMQSFCVIATIVLISGGIALLVIGIKGGRDIMENGLYMLYGGFGAVVLYFVFLKLESCFLRNQLVSIVDPSSGDCAASPVHKVNVGDLVLTADAPGEAAVASRVIFVACNDPSELSSTVVIEVAGHRMELTADHLVPRFDAATGRADMVSAGDLRVGDRVLTVFGGEAVTSLRAIDGIGKGMGAVCDIKTERGTVVADGIVASVAATDHTLSQLAWLPVRLAPALVATPKRVAVVHLVSRVLHGLFAVLNGSGLRKQLPLLASVHHVSVHSEL